MGLKSYEELLKESNEEFNKKVKELMKKFLHKKTSWAFSFHDRTYTGYKDKVCEFCGKTLRRRKEDLSKFYKISKKDLKKFYEENAKN